jgi:hypothetical protein
VANISVEHGGNCVLCHESTDPDVVFAIANNLVTCDACHDLGTAHTAFHDGGTADPTCLSCHVANISTEHADNCALCHESTDPDVVFAIANNLVTCDSCHDVAGAHDALHDGGTADPGCLSCHDGNISTEHGGTCATCHNSTDPVVIAAIAANDVTCDACHDLGTAHAAFHDGGTADPACLACHDGNVSTEHADACATCHSSADPAVIAAIAANDVSCGACHDTATAHSVLHDGGTTDPACLTCHDGNISVEHGDVCATCHESTDPTVTGAIAAGEIECDACHGTVNHATVHAGIAQAECTTCHGADVAAIHASCAVCHTTPPPAGANCSTCHTTLSPSHGLVSSTTWTYQDLHDIAAKTEGGYADCVTCHAVGADPNPHGGYDTSTNKCKVCHAVHRAEGAYYLLRADSQDDACDYCHIGGSAHSSKIVYDLNSAGKATTNGHTIGASTYIPDSTVAQWTETITLETVDADMNPLAESIEVRAYGEQKNDMYRFARHHGHSAATGAARRNYIAVGPLALRCMSCHQVHNAEAQTWNSVAMANIGEAGEYTVANAGTNAVGTSGYKLLKQFPSGTFTSSDTSTVPDAYGQIPLDAISLVPETTLTAGVNFDDVRAMGSAPGALSLARDYNNDGDVTDSGETVAMNRPLWVAQGFDGEHDPAAYLAEESIASAVNNAALSVWCADCHNLNIGGWEHLANEELGFKAHTERTHPAPFTGAHSGPGQCYSCHRNDLPRINTGDSCSQCHYGTGNYKENRDEADAEYVASDFPHSGEDGDYKMLGSYSIVRTNLANNTTIDEAVVVGSTNLDAVCIRCHGGIGTFH